MADDIYSIAEQFKAALLKRERAAAVQLVKNYGSIWNRLKSQLDKLTTQIEEARGRGEIVNQSWLYRQQRYFALLNQVTDEIGKFADLAGRSITKEQRAAVKAARNDSQRLLLAAAENASGIEGTFNRLPKSAVESIAGFLGNGSPLKTLLDVLPQDAGKKVADGLLNAVALGWNPTKTAQNIKKELSGNLTRALRISRTETLRAYREATHRTYQQNSDVIEGWYWLASLSGRTCAACIALHGTFHTNDERMKTHVNCRCTQLPAVIGQPSPIKQTGSEWLANQPEETQRQVFGDEASYQAYKSGRLKLEDFVGRRDNLQWGSSYYQLGAGRALAGEGRFPEQPKKPQPPIVIPPVEVQAPAPARIQLSAKDAREKLLELDKRLSKEIVRADEEFFRHNRQLDRTPDDQELRFKVGDLKQRSQDLEKAKAESLRDVLYQDTEANFEVIGVQRENMRQGINAFRRFIGDQWLKGYQIKLNIKRAGTREYYDMRGGIHITKSSAVKIIVHEMGHWLEDREKGIFDKITGFLERRTKDDKIRPLSDFGRGYDRDEKTKPDKFLNPYMGKQYYTALGRRTGSEILSMGLEYFYDNPAKLAKEDPDYFDFIYDLVRGR